MINFFNVSVSGSLQQNIYVFQIGYGDKHAHILEVSLVHPLTLHFPYSWDSKPVYLSLLTNFKEHMGFYSLHYILFGIDQDIKEVVVKVRQKGSKCKSQSQSKSYGKMNQNLCRFPLGDEIF